MIGECEDSMDTNSTDSPDAGRLPQLLSLPPCSARVGTQQGLLSIPFTAGVLAAQNQHVTSMSSQPSSACSSDLQGGSDADRARFHKDPDGSAPIGRAAVDSACSGRPPTDMAPTDRDPIVSGPTGRHPMEGAPVDRAPFGSAPVGRASTDQGLGNRADVTHLPQQMAAGVHGIRRGHRPTEQHSRVEPAAEKDVADQDSEQSVVFEQPSASEAHTSVVQGIPTQLQRSAGAQQAVISAAAANDDCPAGTAQTAVRGAAAMRKPPPQCQAATDMVQVAETHTAGSTGGPVGRRTKVKAKAKPKGLTGHGAKEAMPKGGVGLVKPVSRTIDLSKGHSRTAPQDSSVNTGQAGGKLHHAKASGDCQPSLGMRRSAKTRRSGALPSTKAPLGIPVGSVPSAATHTPVAAALSPRSVTRRGTSVWARAGNGPSRGTSAKPAAAPSRSAVVSHTTANASPRAAANESPRAATASARASPRAAAATARASCMSPRTAAAASTAPPTSSRATAHSPNSSPAHSPVASGRPPFVSTTRKGIPEPTSACPMSPSSPRPASVSPRRMDTGRSAVIPPQRVNAGTPTVLAEQSQPVLPQDADSSAVLAPLQTSTVAEGDDELGSSGCDQQSRWGAISGSLWGQQGPITGPREGYPGAVPAELCTDSGTAGSVSDIPSKNDGNSAKQGGEMFTSSAQHQPPQGRSQRQLGSEASGCSLDAPHTHKQFRPGDSSQSSQHESLMQHTVADLQVPDGKANLESEEDSASSISSMSGGPSGQSGVGGLGVRQAGTSAWNQFPQQPDSVGSIAQLFMMRTRARAVLQVCAACIAACAARCCH